MAAVGSHYLEIEQSDGFSIAMHEFLRRAIEPSVTSLSCSFSIFSNLTPGRDRKVPETMRAASDANQNSKFGGDDLLR